MQKRALSLLTGVLLALAAVQPAQSIPQPQEDYRLNHMIAGGRSVAPMGFLTFCVRTPAACMPQAGSSAVVQTGNQALRQISAVNTRVNAAIRPRGDGRVDVWQADAPFGDCEDYALAKQAELLRLGWPSSSLLLTTARTRDGQNHAVLIVRTPTTDYVLDNLTPRVRPWNETDYKWLKQQAPIDPRQWVKVASAA